MKCLDFIPTHLIMAPKRPYLRVNALTARMNRIASLPQEIFAVVMRTVLGIFTPRLGYDPVSLAAEQFDRWIQDLYDNHDPSVDSTYLPGWLSPYNQS